MRIYKRGNIYWTEADAATLAEVIVPEPDASNPNGFFITNAVTRLRSGC